MSMIYCDAENGFLENLARSHRSFAIMFPSIHIQFRLRCCPCPILWGWQHNVAHRLSMHLCQVGQHQLGHTHWQQPSHTLIMTDTWKIEITEYPTDFVRKCSNVVCSPMNKQLLELRHLHAQAQSNSYPVCCVIHVGLRRPLNHRLHATAFYPDEYRLNICR